MCIQNCWSKLDQIYRQVKYEKIVVYKSSFPASMTEGHNQESKVKSFSETTTATLIIHTHQKTDTVLRKSLDQYLTKLILPWVKETENFKKFHENFNANREATADAKTNTKVTAIALSIILFRWATNDGAWQLWSHSVIVPS